MLTNEIAKSLMAAFINCGLTPKQMLADVEYRRSTGQNSSWVLDELKSELSVTDEPVFMFPDDPESDEPGICRVCGASSEHSYEADEFDSFGGTTEGYEKCTNCGVSISFANLSAII